MAIRAVTDSHYIAHTGPLFKTMKILPFELLVQYFRVKFMYEFKLNIAPRSFFNMWKTRGHMSQGNIRLRNQEDYSIPFARLTWLTIFHFVLFQPPGMRFSLTIAL